MMLSSPYQLLIITREEISRLELSCLTTLMELVIHMEHQGHSNQLSLSTLHIPRHLHHYSQYHLHMPSLNLVIQLELIQFMEELRIFQYLGIQTPQLK